MRPVDEQVEAEISKQETQEDVGGIYKIFLTLAGDDQEVDWKELKQILDHVMRNGSYSFKSNMRVLYIYFSELKKGFSEDICRSLVAMHDEDQSGKLGFEEFKHLLIDITKWKVG